MRIKVVRVPLTNDRLLALGIVRADHADACECYYEPAASLDARRLTPIFVGWRPAWFRTLLVIRNFLVKPLGLRAGSSAHVRLPDEASQGGRLAFFRVLEASPSRVVLRAEDVHLDSELVIDTGGCRLLVVTAVRYRNRFGRFYMACVMPFHLFVVRRFAAHAVRCLLREG